MIPENWRRRGQLLILEDDDEVAAHRATFDDEGVTISFPNRKFKIGDRVRFYKSGEHYPHIFVPEGTMGTVEEVGYGDEDSNQAVDVYPDDFPREAEWNGCFSYVPGEGAPMPFEHITAPSTVFRPWSAIAPAEFGYAWLERIENASRFTKGDVGTPPKRSALHKAHRLFSTWATAFEALYYHVCTFHEESRHSEGGNRDTVKFVCIAAEQGVGFHDTVLVTNRLRSYTWTDFQKDCWKSLSALTPEQESESRVALDFWLERGRNIWLGPPTRD
jgi:hypothetical protein